MTTQEKIQALRELMQKHSIDAWIAPNTDPHQSEYPAPCWKARAWLSGFTGSMGIVVVTQNKAGLWTDARYYLQAEQQLEGTGIELFKLGLPDVPSYPEWLVNELPDQATIGFDGHVFPVSQVEELRAAICMKGIRLLYRQDLLAQIWQDRPGIPIKPVFLLDESIAGESRQSKFSRIREEMRALGAQVHVVSALDDIAWTFNMRGSDIEYNPVTICYAVIAEHEIRLFIKEKKLPSDVKAALQADGVVFSDYDEIVTYLQHLPKDTTVLMDLDKTSQMLKEVLVAQCIILEATNIAATMKAIKNETELNGIRRAHVRDGVAMVKWLYWLDQRIGKGKHTEVTLGDNLSEFRSHGEHFQGLSFPPIVGYQSNGAIVHYRPDAATAAQVKPEGILLIDSGGQYLDGTTDITRTIALSQPTAEQKKDFTLVLKGHIQVAMAKFLRGTTGAQLETFAKAALWQHGRNYGHGTGHGVGCFLNVHEGPQQIKFTSHTPFKPGMLTSNEPGLYREGQYGIRIENLIITVEHEETEFGTFYGFETVTLCPIDLDLVEVSLLTPDERTWLNTYHQTVYEKLVPYLSDDEKAWLQHETRMI